MLYAAETARIQGVDLYSEQSTRIRGWSRVQCAVPRRRGCSELALRRNDQPKHVRDLGGRLQRVRQPARAFAAPHPLRRHPWSPDGNRPPHDVGNIDPRRGGDGRHPISSDSKASHAVLASWRAAWRLARRAMPRDILGSNARLGPLAEHVVPRFSLPDRSTKVAPRADTEPAQGVVQVVRSRRGGTRQLREVERGDEVRHRDTVEIIGVGLDGVARPRRCARPRSSGFSDAAPRPTD